MYQDVFPGTALVAKAPYKMSPIEMKELKFSCKDYCTNVIFAQAHHLGAVQHYL
jgi:hypothetical protein